MQKLKGKTMAILIAAILTISVGAPMAMLPKASAQTQSFPTVAFINVAPNPVEVGQSVTIDFWLAVPLQNVQFAHNMTVVVTKPDGTTQTLGPFQSDYTGGTTTSFTPTTAGNYTFQFFYGGETLGVGETQGFTGDTELPSQSDVVTLVVTQSAPASYYPITPLPTNYWQTPVTAENVQEWYNITGPWLGLAANAFGSTGAYNDSGNYNPYTTGPTTAHILWTKPWAIGGVAGGDAGGTETSNYWSTSQYEPKWNPVVIDGIEYSTWYTTTTGYNNGIVATNLYNGQTMWVLNTTNALVGGMQINWESVNQYGVVGPYIITTGQLPGNAANDAGSGFFAAGEYNLYDAMTGKYVCSIVNGTTPGAGFAGGFMTNDANGNWVGYYVNDTFGSPEVVHPAPGVSQVVTNDQPSINAWNMTDALGLYGSQTVGSQWSISTGSVFNFDNGLMWSNPSVNDTYDGNPLGRVNTLTNTGGLNGGGLSEGQIASNVIVLTYGFGAGINGATSVGESPGWAIEAGFSMTDGSQLWIKNQTETPFTRISENFYNLAGNGVYVEVNMATDVITGYSLNTGKQVWQNTLTVNGAPANAYDDFGIQEIVDSSHGIIYLWGLGGDIWAVNMANGNINWATTTTALQGSPGYETPYSVWPIWVQYGGVMAGQNNVLYLSEGHEYSPPLFHGAQQLALNATNGKLLWSILGFDDTAGEVSYGIMTTFNSYDSQVYAYGRGPSATTVAAPNTGVTVGTPVVITGSVHDVSAGASQEAVAANFPNGLPAVSDASMTQFMEAVYEQQPMPTNVTGVPVTISVLDSNGNYYAIGTTTSDASGNFGLTWTPKIPGNFTVTASFAGTGSYYGSSATTYMYAGSAPTTQPTTTTTTTSSAATTDNYVIGIGIAIIIVLVIIGALIMMTLRKRHP